MPRPFRRRQAKYLSVIAESHFEVRPRMVRGLDYYMRTTFEVVHGGLGAQNSVLGGGRYDGLAESLGSKVHSPGDWFFHWRRPAGDECGRRSRNPTALDLFIVPIGTLRAAPCGSRLRASSGGTVFAVAGGS